MKIKEFIKENENKKIVAYGAGKWGRKLLDYGIKPDFFCDANANRIGDVKGIPCVTPKELFDSIDKYAVIICISNSEIKEEVRRTIGDKRPGIPIFDFVDSIDDRKYEYAVSPKEKLWIHIVIEAEGWILNKFAEKLFENLTSLGHKVTMSNIEEPKADVNHYIIYDVLREVCDAPDVVRTTMITHVDNSRKRDLINLQATHGVTGICMSEDTWMKLQRWGVPADKLCYVNPAHDGIIKPRKIVLGITNRNYSGTTDFRKRDDLILEVMKTLDTNLYKLKIMGAGWNTIVSSLREIGVEVEYYDDFDRDVYINLMPSLDYWLYYGFDEGAMGFLDALAAGVKTIATPQGYHLDVAYGLTYPCTTIDDFVRVLSEIGEERKKTTDAVKTWTWENYTKKHLEIWHFLTKTRELRKLFSHQSEYKDGLYSLLPNNNRADNP